MKLASLKAGGRDGTLLVVSRDLAHCVPVPQVAPTLQAALDDWCGVAGELGSICRLLNNGRLLRDVMPFRVRIEMFDDTRASICGAIDQRVEKSG